MTVMTAIVLNRSRNGGLKTRSFDLPKESLKVMTVMTAIVFFSSGNGAVSAIAVFPHNNTCHMYYYFYR
jgi:hypothetical protein